MFNLFVFNFLFLCRSSTSLRLVAIYLSCVSPVFTFPFFCTFGITIALGQMYRVNLCLTCFFVQFPFLQLFDCTEPSGNISYLCSIPPFLHFYNCHSTKAAVFHVFNFLFLHFPFLHTETIALDQAIYPSLRAVLNAISALGQLSPSLNVDKVQVLGRQMMKSGFKEHC